MSWHPRPHKRRLSNSQHANGKHRRGNRSDRRWAELEQLREEAERKLVDPDDPDDQDNPDENLSTGNQEATL